MKRVIHDEGDHLAMVNCLMLLTKVGESNKTNHKKGGGGGGGGFKCKTCHRQFLSFQALGGHRASHKKLKLKGANLSSSSSLAKKRTKTHMCPICGLEFPVGQALGGHMRKHRKAVNDGLVNIHDHRAVNKPDGARRFDLCLDLNLTPPENDLKLNLWTPPVLNCLI